jgi:hypothetical protein
MKFVLLVFMLTNILLGCANFLVGINSLRYRDFVVAVVCFGCALYLGKLAYVEDKNDRR